MSAEDGTRELLADRRLWRIADRQAHARPVLSSGFPLLDAPLSGGWPRGALIELLHEGHGIGELRLLMPALIALGAGQRQAASRLMLIAPPCLPYAPVFERHGLDVTRLLVVQAGNHADFFWAFEQGIRSGLCAAILAWCGNAQRAALRRIHLAARHSSVWTVLLRPARYRGQPSPASLRMHLQPAGDDRLQLEIFKHRMAGGPVVLTLDLGDA